MTLEELIFSENNAEYLQTLLAILANLPLSDHDKFLAILEKAKEDGKKIYIDEAGLEDILWNSLQIKMIKAK